MDEELIDCMTEAGLDTVEIRLRRAMEGALSRGDISKADEIESSIRDLDEINVCSEDIDRSEVREPRRRNEEPGTMEYF